MSGHPPRPVAKSGFDRKIRVAIVAASLRYVGGQSVQADLLLRHWQDDHEVEAKLIPIDPPFPSFLRWIERIPGLRTVVREPLYLRELWRELQDKGMRDERDVLAALELPTLAAVPLVPIVTNGHLQHRPRVTRQLMPLGVGKENPQA